MKLFLNTLLSVILVSFVFFTGKAQSDYARKVLQTVCAPDFNGRGYVKNGDKKTAIYLVKEIAALNLRQFNNSYFQKFNISVNTFPSEMSLQIGDSVLVAGQDFLITANSNSCKGKFELVFLGKDELSKLQSIRLTNLSDKFLVLDTLGMNDKSFKKKFEEICETNSLKAKGIIEVFDKSLMFGASTEVNDFVHFQVKRQKISTASKTVNLNIENKFYKEYETRNVLGYVEGKSDSFLIFTAHYDHLGRMGKNAYFPGANDNGSGISMILNLAKYYSSLKEKPKYTMVFMFFTGEELGLLGSKYFCENPIFPLKQIKFLINLDVIGSGDKGIQIVNSTIFKKEYEAICKINEAHNYVPKVQLRGAAANSDHYFFYKNGVPSFFIYTLGDYKEYHNIYDQADKVPLTVYNNLYKLLIDWVNEMELRNEKMKE